MSMDNFVNISINICTCVGVGFGVNMYMNTECALAGQAAKTGVAFFKKKKILRTAQSTATSRKQQIHQNIDVG